MRIEPKTFYTFAPGEEVETFSMYGLGWISELPSGTYVRLPEGSAVTWCLNRDGELLPIIRSDVPVTIKAKCLLLGIRP